MTIEEILKTVEEMDRNEFIDLVYNHGISTDMHNAAMAAQDKFWDFEKVIDDEIIPDNYIGWWYFSTDQDFEMRDYRKAYVKKMLITMAYFKTVSKITDKFEKLLTEIDNK